MTESRKDSAMERVEQLDFADTPAAVARLLEVPPESALDLRALNDALSVAFNQDPPEVGAVHEDVAVNDHLRTTVVVPNGHRKQESFRVHGFGLAGFWSV